MNGSATPGIQIGLATLPTFSSHQHSQDIQIYKGRFILASDLRIVQDRKVANGEVARDVSFKYGLWGPYATRSKGGLLDLIPAMPQS